MESSLICTGFGRMPAFILPQFIKARAVVWERVDWIRPAQVRDQLRAVVNTLMNLRVP